MILRHCIAFVVVLSAVVLAGCQSGDTSTVVGTVTLDGAPLAGAELEFTPQGGGRPGYSLTDAEGKYNLKYTRDLDGAPPGKYVVRITTSVTEEGPRGDVKTPEKLPPRYNRESELTADVAKGKANTIDFALKSGK